MNSVLTGEGPATLVVYFAILAVTLMASVLFEWSTLTILLVLGLNSMVPIALAATGEIINEKSGLVNIGLEGIIILSAFFAIFAAEMSGSYAFGLLGGALTGLFLGVFFGVISTHFHGIQIIAGFGLNFTAIAIVVLLLTYVWQTPGYHVLMDNDLRGPRINVGSSSISWFVPLTFVIGVAAIVMLNNTRLGMRLRASGLEPFVTDVSGCDVYRLRIWGAAMGGIGAGLAGAYLSLDFLGSVTRDVSQGRGFIALAALVFAGLGIPRAIMVSFLFGLTEAFGLWMQNAPFAKDFTQAGGNFFLLMLPYLSVLFALALFPNTNVLSRLIGVSYQRAS